LLESKSVSEMVLRFEHLNIYGWVRGERGNLYPSKNTWKDFVNKDYKLYVKVDERSRSTLVLVPPFP
jgi:hypothetical protein